jgi:hypothetical protein
MELDPDQTISAIKALESCDGWKLWLMPLLSDRLSRIRDELLIEQGEEATRELRMEYRLLNGVINRPEQSRKALLRQPEKPSAGNGAP